jgi:hypothetical protein
MSARGFLPVPTDWLELDSATAGSLGKESPEASRTHMSQVPRIYEMLVQGETDQDFHSRSMQPNDQQEAELLRTYRELFTSSPSAHPIRADFIDQHGLVVQAGQHRVQAAKELGIPFVPVQVAAPDEASLEKIRAACENRIVQLSPELARAVPIHRDYDQHIYPDRSRDRPPERHLGIERLEPSRDIPYRYLERER